MIAWVLLGWLAASAATVPTTGAGEATLVVVALPAQADQAIIEALNRLRGEATSVGFEVRLVRAESETLSLQQLENLWAGLRPAAVVGFTRPSGESPTAHAIDVTFLDRSTGKTSVAHLDATDVAEGKERADVVIAVRAVDFIRACMFDALVGRGPPPPAPAPPPPTPAVRRIRRLDIGVGVATLSGPSGFFPAFAPELVAGYRPVRWLRIGITGMGFSSQPMRETLAGQVRLGQWFVGANTTLIVPRWRRLQPMLELGAGEHWVVASGRAVPPVTAKTVTLASPAFSSVVGLAIELVPYLVIELRGGALWLKREARISATEDLYLGSMGWPLWVGSASLSFRP